MLALKAVTAISFLITLFGMINTEPQPGVLRERHVIYAPIKFRTIHHHRIQKVPIVVKKHVYHHENEAKPVFEEDQEEEEEEDDTNHIPHRRPDDLDFLYFHQQEHPNGGIPHHRPHEHFQQSEEAESEDYEYE